MTTRNTLIAAKTQLTSRGTIVKSLEELFERNKTKLVSLEASVDLTDSKALAKLNELHLLAGLIPRRIETAQRDLAEAEAELTRVGQGLCKDFLVPRLLNLKSMAAELVREQMKSILFSENALEKAVETSELVSTAQRLINSPYARVPVASNPKAGQYADALLELLEASEALESRIKSERLNLAPAGSANTATAAV